MKIIDDAINRIYEIRVPSVKLHLQNAPYNFNTATFPLLFIRNLKFNLEFGSNFGNAIDLSNSTGECEIVVVIEAFKQGTAAQNYTKSREIISALAESIVNSSMRLENDGIEVREDFELTGDTVLFVVIANVNFFL